MTLVPQGREAGTAAVLFAPNQTAHSSPSPGTWVLHERRHRLVQPAGAVERGPVQQVLLQRRQPHHSVLDQLAMGRREGQGQSGWQPQRLGWLVASSGHQTTLDKQHYTVHGIPAATSQPTPVPGEAARGRGC